MVQNHVPVYKKELPKRKQTPPPKQEEGLEEIIDPHPKRKHDPNFYNKQLTWQQQKEDKSNKLRMKRALTEIE